MATVPSLSAYLGRIWHADPCSASDFAMEQGLRGVMEGLEEIVKHASVLQENLQQLLGHTPLKAFSLLILPPEWIASGPDRILTASIANAGTR
ncbi:MAG: hypothetical protein HY520_04340 [Candidatus Aenigmarchaeota archaeon]|nr:hypothetical protein [Candidatus Aenigmarchaeota archaeon]